MYRKQRFPLSYTAAHKKGGCGIIWKKGDIRVDSLFLILAMISFAFIPMALIRPSLIKMKSRLRAFIITFGLTVMFFSLFMATTDHESEKSGDNEKVEIAKEDKEKQETKIEIDKEIEINGAFVKLQSVKINDNTASLYAYWNNRTLYEAHFDYLVPLDIFQGDDRDTALDIKDRDKTYRKIKPGIDGNLDLEIELTNQHDDIVFVFYDYDNDETEEIIVKLE